MKKVKEFVDNILYVICFPLRLIDKHTAMFSYKYFEEDSRPKGGKG